MKEMKCKKRGKGLLLALLMAAMVTIIVGAVPVAAAAKYKVTFTNNSGKSTSAKFTSLNTTVKKGRYLTLPAVPKYSGYTAVGWTRARGKSTPLYEAGDRVRITRNTKFYGVYKKNKVYTVNFYLGNGRSNSAYKALKTSVLDNKLIRLPAVPERKGYVALGWTTEKGSADSILKPGRRYRVKANTKFYAVQEKSATVVLHYNGGGVYKNVNVGYGDSLRLPGVSNKSGHTFMGWSTKPRQTANPTYEAGEKVRVKGTLHLYAVVFDRSAEENVTPIQPDLGKYKKVIFVGDSRTVRMSSTITRQYGASALQGVSFICKGSQGLSWLEDEAYEQLLKEVGSGKRKQTAVVFNLGVNDLKKINSYVKYMNKIAPELKKRGCKLFYMSVNPVNNRMIVQRGRKNRPEETIRQFNATIKSKLRKNYIFIDTYSWLMKSGYGTDEGSGKDTGIDDGLHYTTTTYKRIFNYCVRRVNNYA